MKQFLAGRAMAFLVVQLLPTGNNQDGGCGAWPRRTAAVSE